MDSDLVLGAGHEEMGEAGERRDAREIARRVVGDAFDHARRHGVRGRQSKDCVAIGIRFGDRIGGDRAARAGPVFKHERLANTLGDLIEHEARDDVVGAAWRQRDNHADRLGRVGLRAGDVRSSACQHQRASEPCHATTGIQSERACHHGLRSMV